jgi:hypothetical protein
VCEYWSVILREEHKAGVFENRMLRNIFGRKRVQVIGRAENCIMRSFMICTYVQILMLVDQPSEGRMQGFGLVACVGKQINAYRVMVGKPAERGNLEDTDINGRILKYI